MLYKDPCCYKVLVTGSDKMDKYIKKINSLGAVRPPPCDRWAMEDVTTSRLRRD